MTRRTSQRRSSSRRRTSRTSLRRNHANALASKFFTVFAGILTQEDQKQTARETKRGGRGNIYRLSHYLGALHRVEESVQGFVGDDVSTMIQIRAALDVAFTGPLRDKLCKIVDAYLEHGTLPKYPVSKVARGPAQRELPLRGNGVFDACAYCKSPPGRHRWWCKKLAKNGERLSVEDHEAEQRGYNQLMTFANDAYNKAYKALDKDDYASAVKWFRAAAKYHTEAAIAAAPRHKEEHRNLAGSCKREAEIYSLPPDGMWRARGYR